MLSPTIALMPSCQAIRSDKAILNRRGLKSMIQCNIDDAASDWVIDYPMTERVFQKLGIDYSCGGVSLKYACHRQELDPQKVLSGLCDIIIQTSDNTNTSV